MGKIFVPLLSSSVGACCRFSVRFIPIVNTSEVSSLFTCSGKISHEGSGKGGCLVGSDACSRTLVGLVVPVSALIAAPRKRNDPTQKSQQKSIPSERWPFHKEAGGGGPLQREEGTISAVVRTEFIAQGRRSQPPMQKSIHEWVCFWRREQGTRSFLNRTYG